MTFRKFYCLLMAKKDHKLDIDKIRIDHHVCSVLLILPVIIRDRIQCQNIYDLSGFIVSDDLMLMDGTGICTGCSDINFSEKTEH